MDQGDPAFQYVFNDKPMASSQDMGPHQLY